MTGAILQLVANTGAPQNIWLDQNPQITFFKRVIRRHTPFAIESIPVDFNSVLDFGKSSTLTIPPHGDLINKIYFVTEIPEISASFKTTKSLDITNLINNTNLTDTSLMNTLRSSLQNRQYIDFYKLFQIIDQISNDYQQQQDNLVKIINIMKTYNINSLPHLDTSTFNNTIYNLMSNSITDYKIKLVDNWIFSFKKNYLLFQFLKSIYYSQYYAIQNTQLLNTKTITDDIMDDLFPNINTLINIEDKGIQLFDFYGPNFHNILNTYNLVINVLKSLAKTVPIIISRPFFVGHNYDIYNNVTPTNIDNTITFTTIIDPSYKNKFITNILDNEKIIEDNIFYPIDLTDTYSTIYPNIYETQYLRLFKIQTNALFNNIRNFANDIFERYRTSLFDSTNKLFYNNSGNPSNIYSYIIPNIPFQYKINNRIKNVFNLNIWYFYFFKYLDSFDQSEFSQYIAATIDHFSIDSINYLNNLLILIKINLEYYMNEYSYLLNDLYTESPSTNATDTMKNYIPVSASIIDNINITDDLLGLTIIFHRNHIPSISQLFEYVYDYIDNITFQESNQYLGIDDVPEIELGHFFQIKSIVKSLYQNIYKYFMDTYDQFGFEAPANYTKNMNPDVNPNVNVNNIVSNYVNYFLRGINDTNNFKSNNLSHVVQQMEFYFVAEMMYQRNIQNYYHNLLTNTELLSSEILDPSVRNIINQITDHIKNQGDDLYYKIPSIHRFTGKSYLNTPYVSRHYDYIEVPIAPPIPKPPKNPYGVNSLYYDQNHLYNDNDNIVNWISPPNLFSLNTQNNNTIFQEYPIDFYKINHRILHNYSHNLHWIDDYNFNLVKLSNLIKNNVNLTYANYYWIWSSLFNIIKHTNPNVLRDKTQKNYISYLSDYLNVIEDMLYDDSNSKSELPNNIHELSDIITEIIELNDNNRGIEILNRISNINLIQLANNNKQLNNMTNIKNPIEFSTILRDSFITQYYFYTKYYDNISQIVDNSQIMNMKPINVIINTISNKTYKNISNLSTMIYLHPDAHPEKISLIVQEYQSQMTNDFDKYIFTKFTNFMNFDNPSKLTFADIYYLINTTLIMMNTIYNHCKQNNCLSDVVMILAKYQPTIIQKMSFIADVLKYFANNEMTNSSIEIINQLKIISDKYEFVDNINITDYITDILLPYYSNLRKQYNGLAIIHKLQQKLTADFDDMLGVPKYMIITDLVNNTLTNDKLLINTFSNIDNDYYAYLYYYLDYLNNNVSDTESLIYNPLLSMQYYDIPQFDNVHDLILYLMQYVWEYTISLPEKDIINISQNEQISDITQPLDDVIFHDIIQRQNIIQKLLTDSQHKILILCQQQSELDSLYDKISSIMYRNKKAKTAWIRKLGHFLVKQINFKFSDEQLDSYNSDWMESYYRLNIGQDHQDGYHKMIGHIPELYTYNNDTKPSHLIFLPLLFYFNNDTSVALPLNCSMNTKFEIEIQIRDLESVIYKEAFSDFIKKPKLGKSYLMVEYIYLSDNERKIFASKNLEYLVTQTQINETIISDDKLKSIYRIAGSKKILQYKKDGIKIKDEIYDTKSMRYVNEDELHLSEKMNYELLARSSYVPVKINDRRPINAYIMTNMSNTNDMVHMKQTKIDNLFYNPTKLFVSLIKPLAHTNIYYRKNNNDYFHGELQWDNYTLNSYYDHTHLNTVKRKHLANMATSIKDVEDTIFGFMKIAKTMIDNAHDHRLIKYLDKIISKYPITSSDMPDNPNLVQLIEDLMMMNYDFIIDNALILENMIIDIADLLGLTNYTYKNIHGVNNKVMSKNDFFILMQKVFNRELEIAAIKILELQQMADTIYQKYLQTNIMILVKTISQYIDLKNMPYDFDNIIEYFHGLYTILPTKNTMIHEILMQIPLRPYSTIKNDPINLASSRFMYLIIESMMIDKYTISELYNDIIPWSVIKYISNEFVKIQNQLVNDYPIQEVDDYKYLVENPIINPLITGYLQFNGVSIKPENSTSIMWSDIPAYSYGHHNPGDGLNFHTWSLDISSYQPQGYANLTRIDEFTSIYNVHPKIGNDYPATVVNMTSCYNIMRFISGMCGIAWTSIEKDGVEKN